MSATEMDHFGRTCVVTASCTYQTKINERHKVFRQAYDLHKCIPRSSHSHVHEFELDATEVSKALHRS